MSDISLEQLMASAYLARLANEIEYQPWLHNPGLAADRLQHILADLEDVSKPRDWDIEAIEQYLTAAKKEFVVALCIADMGAAMSTEDVGRAQARCAAAALDLALRATWHSPAIKKLCVDLGEPGDVVPGLFILGLGKLGGEDLNFSSDIDLIGFFDSDRVPVNPMQGKVDVCARVLKQVTRMLSGEGGRELLWRVDWRLRPESSATQIAMSTKAALDYYYFRSMPWHRLALMKARVVAGDLAVGKQFLHDLERFIWRQNLDFRAIEELAYLKDRIDLEHPQLAVRGKRDNRIDDRADDFNLKLGTGGIREIEFFTNGLQLIWGGKIPELRTGHTMSALRQLAAEQLITSEQSHMLEQQYLWLRQLENRVQMLENRQTHLVPSLLDEKARYQILASIPDWSAFERQLRDCRTDVHQEFDALFRPDVDATVSDELVVLDVTGLADRTAEIVQQWSDGFRCYGVSEAQAIRMQGLYQSLIAEVLRSSVAIEEAVDRLHAFFLTLPPGGQYLRLLQSSPKLLRGLVVPLIYSPPMQTLLRQTPHIIDSLLQVENTSRTGDSWPFDSAWVLQNPDYDVRLERMRRQVNEELYQLYLRFLEGGLNPVCFQDLLTGLAIFSLHLGIEVVEGKLGSEPEFAILGMGKLGMSRMAPMSDLDITYVCSDAVSIDQATRFVNRLQTALSARMREGVVYEMDTRLRPSGRSGAPTISLASFRSYQNERAKNWEHLALVASRPIVGKSPLTSEIGQIRQQVLARRRDARQFKIDAAKMLLRIREQRIVGKAHEDFHTKLCPGGLMETEYLIACLTIRLGPDNQELLTMEYPQMVERLCEIAGQSKLAEILQFWRIMQVWERLLGLEGKVLTAIPDLFRARVFEHLHVADNNELKARIEEYSDYVLKALATELAMSEEDAALLSDWAEEPVCWS